MRKPLFVDVRFTVITRTRRSSSNGPSTCCSDTPFSRPMLLNLFLFEVTSFQHYVSLHIQKISVHRVSSLVGLCSRLQCFFVCLTEYVLGQNFWLRQQCSYHCNPLIATPLTLLSFPKDTISQFVLGNSRVHESFVEFQFFPTNSRQRNTWFFCCEISTFVLLQIDGWGTWKWFQLCVQFLLCWVQLYARFCLLDLIL